MTTDPVARRSQAAISLARAVRDEQRNSTPETRRARAAAEAELNAARLHKAIAAALAVEGGYTLLAADREHLANYLLAGGDR